MLTYACLPAQGQHGAAMASRAHVGEDEARGGLGRAPADEAGVLSREQVEAALRTGKVNAVCAAMRAAVEARMRGHGVEGDSGAHEGGPLFVCLCVCLYVCA